VAYGYEPVQAKLAHDNAHKLFGPGSRLD